MGLLNGKTALITGAARGIGKAIALKYASEGANIAFTDLVIDENAENTVRELEAFGVKAKGYASNAANFEETQTVVNQIKEDREMKATISLDSLWQIVSSLSLRNQKWLAGKLQESIRQREETEYISKEELLAGIDAGLKDLKAGRMRPIEELFKELEHEVQD